MYQDKHKIAARKVFFDFSKSDLVWIPDDHFSSHVMNGVNLLLPAGEFWFCRVYNRALPYITDENLKDDVIGFIRQEAIHANAHIAGQKFLTAHNISIDEAKKIPELIFGTLLSDQPLGMSSLNLKTIEYPWLVFRVGIIAAIEHFTGVIGQWCMDNKSWDEFQADPVIADLFRWHLAEEVEHRNVAFDLFAHLVQNKFGFYISRQVLMAAIFPLFMYLVAECGRSIAKQDNDEEMQKLVRKSFIGLMIELEKIGRKTKNVPTFSHLAKSVLRWGSPFYHPENEGNTEQALSYLNQSTAVNAAKFIH
ncbi:metal-dependent hydrolase [Acinetobacter ursingii]|uniref:metal-dependent hydrolase n=1 Tax=Acinetobacter ursingii TaxID=108980 RepID=UPI00124FAB97|nr:metal-dependent hydrolase [Acinetobacter ursingii]MCU4351917.1 metal-dependent hydrolase [Acinetobacter ursingii]MDI3239635.1 metal-dependent hydrolase [Acinetobacter ursingii]